MKKIVALRRPLGHKGRVESHNAGSRRKKHVASATEINTTKTQMDRRLCTKIVQMDRRLCTKIVGQK